jgi:hypothetical protein
VIAVGQSDEVGIGHLQIVQQGMVMGEFIGKFVGGMGHLIVLLWSMRRNCGAIPGSALRCVKTSRAHT